MLFGEEEAAAVYLPEYYDAERCVALALRETMRIPQHGGKSAAAAIRRLEAVNGIRYAPLQKQAIEKALGENALVLTGGPGTGKTTAVNGMLAAFEENGDRVALAAPTGRAAKRLSELTGRKAKTIHRLLEVDHTAADSTRFLHNAKNPLKCDVIVIDEMSMVDVLLFQSLLNALKPIAAASLWLAMRTSCPAWARAMCWPACMCKRPCAGGAPEGDIPPGCAKPYHLQRARALWRAWRRRRARATATSSSWNVPRRRRARRWCATLWPAACRRATATTPLRTFRCCAPPKWALWAHRRCARRCSSG